MSKPDLLERCARALYRSANDDDVSDAALDATFSAVAHSGDCTKECHTCMRCEADWARRCCNAVLTEFLTACGEPEMVERCADIVWKCVNDDGVIIVNVASRMPRIIARAIIGALAREVDGADDIRVADGNGGSRE